MCTNFWVGDFYAIILGWKLSFKTRIKNQKFSVANEKICIQFSQLFFELSFLYKISLFFSKMEKNRGITRELLKFEFELGHSAKEAMDNINRAKGNGTVSKATAYCGTRSSEATKWILKTKKGPDALGKSTESLSSTLSKPIRR